MRNKKFIFCLLVLITVLAVAMGMIACTSDSKTPEDETEETDDSGTESSTMRVVDYLGVVHEGLSGAMDYSEELKEYAVHSSYTFNTVTANYTLDYAAMYTEVNEQNKYYLRLFDNALHINRATLYYDSKNLYVLNGEGSYLVEDFNSLLLYTVFERFIRLVDFRELFYDIMIDYFKGSSGIAGLFSVKDITYVTVDKTRKAMTFNNADLSIVVSMLNAQIEAWTDGIGTSFDAVSYRYLGFKLSRLIEYTFNSIVLEKIQFLFRNEEKADKTITSDVYCTTIRVAGRMLDGSDYSIDMKYSYDTDTVALTEGEALLTDSTVSSATGETVAREFEKFTPGQASYEGTVSFPTLRDDPYLAALDYNLNAEDNLKNEFTFRIYDQNATQGEVKDKYGNITEFLSVYYYNETLYINAQGLCDAIGTPIDLTGLHLQRVYVTDINMVSALETVYNYLIRIVMTIIDGDYRDTVANKNLYKALMEAIESSDDLSTIFMTVTEDLVKEIRNDDTAVSVLLSRKLGGEDDLVDRYLGAEFFRLAKVIVSYKFTTSELMFDNYYADKLYAAVNLTSDTYEGVVFPNNLNELYYSPLTTPEVITLTYDAYMTPYEVDSVELGNFFGIFVGDSSGKNAQYTLNSGERLAIVGEVSEFYRTGTDGEQVPTTSVNLTFYKRNPTENTETRLMTVVTNPQDLDELMIGYYMPLGSYAESDGLLFRVKKDKVTEELQKLTGEKSAFANETGLGVLLALFGGMQGNSQTYIRNGYYCVSLMTSRGEDPLYDLIGVANTYAFAKIKVGFTSVDLSNVRPSDYADPNILPLENRSVTSIYETGSAWTKTCNTVINGKTVAMELTYDQESVTVRTGQKEYKPTAFLFGKEVGYTVRVVNEEGTYRIGSLLMSAESTRTDYAYTYLKTGNLDPTSDGVAKPSYALIIDPAYTKVLPTTTEVRYDNFEVGNADCCIEGFTETNITGEGYNLSVIAGDYADDVTWYTLTVGIDSLATVSFPIYIAVLNRSVLAYQTGSRVTVGEEMAFINNELAYERSVGREATEGEEQYTVIGGVTVPVVGTVSVDPYSYAMMKKENPSYNVIADSVNKQQLILYFKSYYGSAKDTDENGNEIVINKYYDKDGFNRIYSADRIASWTFDPSCITWNGGMYYAYAYYGNTDSGYAVKVALRIDVQRKKVSEVRIDAESNSTYTVDYLIKSTYTIPTTGTGDHTVTVVFEDESSRLLVPVRSGAISDDEFYSKYILGSLNWEGNDQIASRITVNGTSSLFGEKEESTSVTTAQFGESLGVGVQTVTLHVSQPSRYQSTDDEKSMYLTTRYILNGEGKITDKEKGQVSVSYTKFKSTDEAQVAYEINPYDFSASLPNTVWLYVARDNAGHKTWKEYPIVWQTTDKSGRETNILRESNGVFVLANPVIEQTSLAVYGLVGDGIEPIWITMVVNNLASELQSITFYTYSYVKQTVTVGDETDRDDKEYYEYYTEGYARTTDTVFMSGKYYYQKVISEATGTVSYVPYTAYKTGSTMPNGTVFYEEVQNGYGLTDDAAFLAGKEYYLYIGAESDSTATVSVDPYDDYTYLLPQEYKAVLGSGVAVSSTDVDENGIRKGLQWFVVLTDMSDDTEYPVDRTTEFVDTKYNRYYDSNNKFIFPYNAGKGQLKCYIKGSGSIANEVVLNLTVRSRVLLNAEYEFTVVDEESGNPVTKTVVGHTADLFNGASETDIYRTSGTTGNNGIYAESYVGGYTAVTQYTVDIDRYKPFSSALQNRLILMRTAQQNGEENRIGVRFGTSELMYSLPVVWNEEGLDRLIDIFAGTEQLTVDESGTGLFLVGTIATGTVNQQSIKILFTFRTDALTGITLNVAGTMINSSVYTVRNDGNGDNILTVTEMASALNEYDEANNYVRYIGGTSKQEAYGAGDYSYLFYFDITRPYGLYRENTERFCSPYEYLQYLFANLTLSFSAGAKVTADASEWFGMISSKNAADGLDDYFNRSVLGLRAETLDDDGYSYSFICLNRFSQGSAECRTLLILRSERATYSNLSSTLTMEVFDGKLSEEYGLEGYELPEYVTVEYIGKDDNVYTVNYTVDKWSVSTKSSTVLGKNPLKKIDARYIDVTTGEEYNFSYACPFMDEQYYLTVKIPKKDMKETGYSAVGELYDIVDGCISVDNPYNFFYYSAAKETYLFDTEKIPTIITANMTDTYQKTDVNEYEVSWKFSYQINADIFTYGSEKMLIATVRYSAYSDVATGRAKDQCDLKLYLKVAALSYYGVTDLEEDAGTTIAYTTDAESNVLHNDIHIDPYKSSYNGVYNMPTSVTVQFYSTHVGSAEKQIVTHRFSGVYYALSDGSGKATRDITKVPYNEIGHTLSGIADPNTVPCIMFVNIGNDADNFAGGVSLLVTIESRIISEVEVGNTVYKNGEYAYMTDSVYYFTQANVNSGSYVTVGAYYEKQDGRYYLTEDSTFVKGKTYYIRNNGKVTDGNADIYSRATVHYEQTEDTEYKSGKTYYYAQKASVTPGAAVQTTYYIRCSGYIPVEDGEEYTGGNTYAYKDDGGKYYRYDYENSLWKTVTTSKAGDIKLTEKKLTADDYGTEIPDGYYRSVDFYVPVRGTVDAYTLPKEAQALDGRSYYSVKEAVGVVGAITSEYYYSPSVNYYVRAYGEFDPDEKYYTVSLETPTVNSALNGKYFVKTVDYTEFDASKTYYLQTKTGKNPYGYTEDGRYYPVLADSYSGTKYYFVTTTVTEGYRLSETYYEASGDRYIPTEDATFSGTKNYYIFRTKKTVAGEEPSSDTYVLFDGYEPTSYYAYAERETSSAVTTANIPVYYIDPYNTATFRLPSEVNLIFTTTSSFESYRVQGWEEYDESTMTGTEFTRYIENNGDADALESRTSSVTGLNVYDGELSPGFYQMISQRNNTFYGYYQPSEEDYGGAFRLIRGYISIGTDRKQYFYIAVVVLNRSLRVGDLLQTQYNVSYDYDDPVAALLDDIPVAMGQDMFVSYDSYYLNFNMYGYDYTVQEQSMFGYKNGNVPVVPDIEWEDSWTYEGKEYTFDGITTTGYDGDIYGNVHGENRNFSDLYDYYYADVSEQYYTLIRSWMWDIFVSENYAASVKEKINALNSELAREVKVLTYNLLIEKYRISSETEEQQYVTLLEKSYYNEAFTQYNALGNRIEEGDESGVPYVVEYLYTLLGGYYDSWESAGKKESSRTVRVTVFEDWKNLIDEYLTEENTPATAVDAMTVAVTDYQKLKANKYLTLTANASVFGSDEVKNASYYQQYETRIADCINRDVWDSLSEYASATERAQMALILQQITLGTDTSKKSLALTRMKATETDGVRGEDTYARITLPVLSYSRLLDGSGKTVTTVYFNPFYLDSMEESYTVEFILDYGNIYETQIERAENDIIEAYRETYRVEAMDELENVLKEQGIDGITPYVYNSATGEDEPQLQFAWKGKTYVFDYDSYVLYHKGTDDEIYPVNYTLWNGLIDYYEQEAVRYIDAVIPNKGSVSKSEWTALKNTYLHLDEDEVYINAVTAKMDVLGAKADKGGSEYTYVNARADLVDYVVSRYPVLVAMQRYYDEQADGVYALISDELYTASVSPYSNVSTLVGSQESIFVSMYGSPDGINNIQNIDINGFYTARALTLWMTYFGTEESVPGSSAAFREAVNTFDGNTADNADRDGLAFAYLTYVGDDTQKESVRALAERMYDFLREYVVNTGKTPYRLFAEQAEDFGLSESDLTQYCEYVKESENYCRFESSLEYLASCDEFCGLSNNAPKTLSSLLLSRFAAASTAELATKLKEAFAEYLVFDLLKGVIVGQNSESVTYKTLMENIEDETLVAVRAQAVKNLFSVYPTVERYLAEPTVVNNITTQAFFEEPKAVSATVSDAGKYSIKSLAFEAMVEEKGKTGENYAVDRESRQQEYAEANGYTGSKTILDSLYRAVVDNGANSGDNTFGDNRFLLNNYFRSFVGSSAYATPADFVGTNGTSVNIDGFFLREATLLYSAYPQVFTDAVTKEVASFDAVKTYIQSYLKDYRLRAVLYYYENIANTVQKRIVAEVAGFYGCEAVTEEGLLSASYKYGGIGNIGSKLFAELSGRYDIGADVETQLKNAYYTFYLDQGQAMVAYAVQELDRDAMSLDNSYQQNYKNTLKYIAAMKGVVTDELSEEDRDAASVIAERMYLEYADKQTRALVTKYLTAVEKTMMRDYAPELYGYYYTEELYREELDEILNFIVMGWSTTDNTDRYNRVNAILETYFEGEKPSDNIYFPKNNDYYNNVYDTLKDNAVRDKLAVFDKALKTSVEISVGADVYDELSILVASSRAFLAAMYHYLNGYAAEDVGTARDFFLTEGGTLYYTSGNKYDDKLNGWWRNGTENGTEFLRIAQKYIDGATLSTAESEVIESVYYQLKYKRGDETDGYRYVPSVLYRLLVGTENARDGQSEKDEGIEKSSLTVANIVDGDYSEVTAEYKFYIVDLLLNGTVMDEECSLAKTTLQEKYNEYLQGKSVWFAGKAGILLTGEEDGITVICTALMQVAGDEYADYLNNALEIMRCTSVYNELELSSENPLLTYVQSVKMSIVGDTDGTYALTEKANEFGRLTFDYFYDKSGSAQQAIEYLRQERTVTAVYYSADRLTADSDEDSLRHVIYFDAGKITWNEEERESLSPSATGRIYFANAFKTTESVYVKSTKGYDVSGLVHDYTSYVLFEDASRTETAVRYSNAFYDEAVSFRLQEITTIGLLFDGMSEYNTINIDVLNPTLETTAQAIGYVGTETNPKNGVNLGTVRYIEYADEFYKLFYENVEGDVEFSKQIELDDAFTVKAYAENGTVYEVRLNVNYYNRTVTELMLSTDVYAETPVLASDGSGYYTAYDSGLKKNIIYIDPIQPDLLLSDYSGYRMPDTVRVKYGSGQNASYEKYTNVQWSTDEPITPSLAGTNGYVAARITSYMAENDAGYSLIEFDYTKLTLTLTECSALGIKTGESKQFSLQKTVDWNVYVYVADKTVTKLYGENGTELLGELVSGGAILAATADQENGKLIYRPTYTVNQYSPEYPTDISMVCKDGTTIPLKDMTQKSWTASQEELRKIIRGDAVKSDADPCYSFTASFKYYAYTIYVKFYVYEISLKDIVKNNGGQPIAGGTLYLVTDQGSAEEQLTDYYSTVYYNFGSSDEPMWLPVPLSFAKTTLSKILTRSENTYESVEGYLGVTDTTWISANITFTIKVISPRLFAQLDEGLNNYVTYDYFVSAKDGAGNRRASNIDEPDYYGLFFAQSADGLPRFFIDKTAIEYNFNDEEVKIGVTYAMEYTDSRLGFDGEGRQVYGFSVVLPLYSYLYDSILSNESKVEFDAEDSGQLWTWVDEDKNSTVKNAIKWPLGVPMSMSDLPLGKITSGVDTFSVRFFWDLSEINVNLASDTGYTIYGYYYTNINRWSCIELTVYIDKIDATAALIKYINGNNGTTMDKTYDARFYKLNFSSSDTYLRSDGSYARLEDEFTVQYKNAAATDGEWSTTAYPIDAGTYYIRILLDDYNYRLRSTVNGKEENCLMMELIIAPYVIDISNVTFIGQDGNVIENVYNGKMQEVVYVDWFYDAFAEVSVIEGTLVDQSLYYEKDTDVYIPTKDSVFVAGKKYYILTSDKDILYQAAYADEQDEDAASAAAYDVVFNRSSATLQSYLGALYQSALEKVRKTYTDAEWEAFSEENKARKTKSYLYQNVLQDGVLPSVTVDNWFSAGERDKLYMMYKEGRGSGMHSGILYSTAEAKALVFDDIYDRVSTSSQEMMWTWYSTVQRQHPVYTEIQVKEAVYDSYMTAVMTNCEVKLHIEYREGSRTMTHAPEDVGTSYTAVITVLPEENNGNYISTYTKNSEGVITVTEVSRAIYIEKDTSVTYEIKAEDKEMVYKGIPQNPVVSPVVDEDGTVAKGVTITYTYTYVADDAAHTEYTLVVVRNADGETVDMSRSSKGLTLPGILNRGDYSVVVEIDGGINYIGGLIEEPALKIVPADIYIELDDINAYYLEEVKDLGDFIRIHSLRTEYEDDGDLEDFILRNDTVFGGVCGCGAKLSITVRDGTYTMRCPTCEVEMSVEFSNNTSCCMCTACRKNRVSGGSEWSVLEKVSESSGIITYTVTCPRTAVVYTLTVNNGRFLGNESVGDFGELVYGTEVTNIYPIGDYSANVYGFRLKGMEKTYTAFSSTTRGNYTLLELKHATQDYPESLEWDKETYASILQLYKNYNIYVKRSSYYTVTTEDGAVGIGSDAELTAALNGLEDGDSAVWYLDAKKDLDGNVVGYNPIVIDKDVNITLVGYYDAATGQIATKMSGITLKKGTLTLHILSFAVATSGGYGVKVESGASTVYINECIFEKVGNVQNTTGVKTSVGFTEKVSISNNTIFRNLNMGISLEGGKLEIKDSVFRNNYVGIGISTEDDDVTVRSSTFSNHGGYAIRSINANISVLEDVFVYNKVAIEVPSIKNYDIYKNTFTDENTGIDTNGTDIIVTEEE